MPTRKLVSLLPMIWIMIAGCSNKTATRSAPEPVAESSGPRIYVDNEVSGDMTVIDSGTYKVIATIPLGKRPRGIHASPDHKTIYIALSGSPIAGPGVDESTLPPADHKYDGIGVFDVQQNKLIKVIPAGNDPENFDVSKDGKQIYVSNEDDSAVSIIDLEAGKVVKSLKMGAQPEGVQLTPNGKQVYVTSEEDGNISVLDPAAEKILTTFKVGHRPRNVAFLSDGRHAYVNAENDGTVDLLDTVKHKVVQTISIGKPGIIKPMDVILSADSSKLYVSTGRGHLVVTVDTKTNAVLNSVDVGGRPWGIALSLDGKTLYSANGSSNDISVVDLAANAVTHKIKCGTGPWGVLVLPR
jgi:YVTN family beta-propeller protein